MCISSSDNYCSRVSVVSSHTFVHIPEKVTRWSLYKGFVYEYYSYTLVKNPLQNIWTYRFIVYIYECQSLYLSFVYKSYTYAPIIVKCRIVIMVNYCSSIFKSTHGIKLFPFLYSIKIFIWRFQIYDADSRGSAVKNTNDTFKYLAGLVIEKGQPNWQ